MEFIEDNLIAIIALIISVISLGISSIRLRLAKRSAEIDLKEWNTNELIQVRKDCMILYDQLSDMKIKISNAKKSYSETEMKYAKLISIEDTLENIRGELTVVPTEIRALEKHTRERGKFKEILLEYKVEFENWKTIFESEKSLFEELTK